MLQESFVGAIGHCRHRRPHEVNVSCPGEAYKDFKMPRAMSVANASGFVRDSTSAASESAVWICNHACNSERRIHVRVRQSSNSVTSCPMES